MADAGCVKFTDFYVADVFSKLEMNVLRNMKPIVLNVFICVKYKALMRLFLCF